MPRIRRFHRTAVCLALALTTAIAAHAEPNQQSSEETPGSEATDVGVETSFEQKSDGVPIDPPRPMRRGRDPANITPNPSPSIQPDGTVRYPDSYAPRASVSSSIQSDSRQIRGESKMQNNRIAAAMSIILFQKFVPRDRLESWGMVVVLIGLGAAAIRGSDSETYFK